MPRYRVIPYRAGSRGATALSRALGGLCLKVDGTSRFRPRHDDVLINWGRTDGWPVEMPRAIGIITCTALNHPDDVVSVSNKRTFFEDNDGAAWLPEFWLNREEIPDEAFPIVCRTVLAGHSGEGIVMANTRADLVNAPLYVKYIKKQDEYRVHVGRRLAESIIISIQQKRRRTDHEDPNWQVRNHANGFIYARGDVAPPVAVTDAARSALEASGLDFGAVDVIYNRHHQRAYVLEINTAPGLEGTTVDDYARFFRNG